LRGFAGVASIRVSSRFAWPCDAGATCALREQLRLEREHARAGIHDLDWRASGGRNPPTTPYGYPVAIASRSGTTANGDTFGLPGSVRGQQSPFFLSSVYMMLQ
jgi:hypothetical protein